MPIYTCNIEAKHNRSNAIISYILYRQRIEDVVSCINQLRVGGGMSVHRTKSGIMPHRILCNKTIIRDIVECFIVEPSDMKYFLILTKKTNIYIWLSILEAPQAG